MLAACYSPSAAVGVPCSSTGDCPSGQHCDTAQTPPTCAAADARPADAAPDAPPRCATNASCAAAAPVCDQTTLTCRGCVADAECGADVCLEHLGQCASESNTLFVDPTGVNTGTCTRMAPCLTIAYALTLVAPNKRTIAVADGLYPNNFTIQSTLGANSLTISGPDRDPAGVVVMIGGSVIVENSSHDIVIEGITMQSTAPRTVDNRGQLTLSRVAITSSMTGLTSTNPNTLRIWDCQITGNAQLGIDVTQTTLEVLRTVVAGNGQGGIDINNAATAIESSIIADNGSTGTAMGGIRYQNLNGRPQVFQFNTVANNLSNGASAVQCSAAISLASSILVDGSGAVPVNGNCEPSYSLFAVAAPAGTGNLMGDPAFAGTGNYHITASSAARDAADPAATANLDIDGEARPQGSGRDIGADEIP